MSLALAVVLAVLAVTVMLGAVGYVIDRSWERHEEAARTRDVTGRP